MDFKNKYLKYKNKYNNLKNIIDQKGGSAEFIEDNDLYYSRVQDKDLIKNKVYLVYNYNGKNDFIIDRGELGKITDVIMNSNISDKEIFYYNKSSISTEKVLKLKAEKREAEAKKEAILIAKENAEKELDSVSSYLKNSSKTEARGIDLSNMTLSKDYKFKKIDFSNANFSNIKFKLSYIRQKPTFEGSLEFEDCNLSKVNFSNIELTNFIKFKNCILDEAKFENTKLSLRLFDSIKSAKRINFKNADFGGNYYTFKGVNFTGANFSGIKNIGFSYSDRLEFDDCILDDANFENTNLEKVKFEN